MRERWDPHGLRALGPAVLTAFLGFRAGGFFAAITGLCALVLIVALILRITLVARPTAGWSVGLGVAAAGLGALGAWTLASTAWSHAPARGLLVLDGVLLYGLVLVLVGMVPTRRGDLAALLRWTTAAWVAICLAGLASRLGPGVFPTQQGVNPERLSFPLTYWNAMGICAALALLALLHLTVSGAERRILRVLAAAALPAVAVTLYLTLSRGAIWVAPLGLLAYVLLALPRGLLTALPAVAVPTLVAVKVAYGKDALTQTDWATATAAHAQGRELAVVLVACGLAAAALRFLALGADARLERISISPGRLRALRWGAVAASLLVLVAAGSAVDAPRRLNNARHTFARGQLMTPPADVRDRLTSISDNGRIANWRVAVDAFRMHPWRGLGAGTYRLSWERRRPAPPLKMNNAHSLYLEVLSELGVPGLAALLVALAAILVGAARRLAGPERHAHALFIAAAAMLLIHAGIDWDWQMPALFVWLFAGGAVVLAAREGALRAPEPGRLPRVLGGLACLLVAITPWLVTTSQLELQQALQAFSRGDCTAAVDHALASARRLSARPEPYEVLGWCDARAGAATLARNAMAAAQLRDPGNWQYAYGLAVTDALAGRDPRADAAKARRENPRESLAIDFARAVSATRSPGRWQRIAQRAQIPVE